MKPKRLAGLATLALGIVFCSVLAHLYLEAPPERQRAVTESLTRFSVHAPLPKVVHTPQFCFKTFTRRAYRVGKGMVVEQKCIAGIEVDATHALLARAVMEGIAARSKM